MLCQPCDKHLCSSVANVFPLLLQNKLTVSGLVEFREPKTVPSSRNSGAHTSQATVRSCVFFLNNPSL